MKEIKGRYYLSSDKYHHEIIKKGLEWLLHSGNEKLVLYIPNLTQLEGTYIASVLGNELATELSKNCKVSFLRRTIYLVTSEKMQPSDGNVRLLAIWPDSNTLTNIENKYEISNMFVIPWNPKEVEEWKNNSHPIELPIFD